VFLDLKAAYDSVRHDKLFAILYSRAKSLYDDQALVHLIDIIRYSYETATMSTGPYAFQSTIGVTQGSVLSPDLFCLYIEHLLMEDSVTAKKIERARDIISSAGVPSTSGDILLLYADDIYVEFATIKEFKDWNRTRQSIWKAYGMTINDKKSAILMKNPPQNQIIIKNIDMDLPTFQHTFNALGIPANLEEFRQQPNGKMRVVMTLPPQYSSLVSQQYGLRNCKLVPSKFVLTSGSSFPIVEHTKYLGILVSFNNAGNWKGTTDSITRKIKRVHGIARFKKSLLTFKTEQVFIASVFRYYSMPYIIAGLIPPH
jgi:hypothetical protein